MELKKLGSSISNIAGEIGKTAVNLCIIQTLLR